MQTVPDDVAHRADAPSPNEPVDVPLCTRDAAKELLLVVAMPLVVLALLRVSPYFKLNNGDPFIYVGYSNAFTSHVERFGYTYHSVRWGLIFPLRASLVFGPVYGYFLLRWFLYLVAIIPMWGVLRPHGRRIALLGPLVFIANPVSAQAILSTHPDTIVVPGVTLVMCCLLLSMRVTGRGRRMGLALVSGVGAGVTLNANIVSTPLLLVCIGACVAVLVAGRRWTEAIETASIFFTAAAATCILGMLVYRQLFGEWNIYQTTWKAINDISDDNVWRTPSLEWMSTRRYIYAPLIALSLAVVALVRRRHARREWPPPHELAAVLIATGALGFYVAHQFVLDGASMEQAYYYSFIIGPTSVVLALAMAWLGDLRRTPTWIVLAVPIVLAWIAQLIEVRWFVVFLAVLVLIVAVLPRSSAAGGGFLALLAMQLCWGTAPRQIAPIEGAGFQYEPHYERAFGDGDWSGFDAYVVASELPHVVPSDPGATVPLLFWYRSGDALLDSTQATYHWETLAVQRRPAPGMPELTADDLDRLRSLTGGFVVVIGSSPEELETGIDALNTVGFVLEVDRPVDRLAHGSATVYVRAVEVVAVPAAPVPADATELTSVD
jgi:hypothetical protein